MERHTLAEIAAYLGKNAPEWAHIAICGLEKDHRNVRPNDLFIAIRGERFDGHDFVCAAAENGAAAALVEYEVAECPIPQLVVSDTVRGLQAIAAGYRREFSPHVVGVTGSVGKTTTKEMIASVLSMKYQTLKTSGNQNNEIGLPFTVCNLTRDHEAAVIEMGMNHFGELSRLTRVAQPEIAVISVIGESHIEFLGSKEGILRAKLEILEGLSPDGCVILNGDDPMLWALRGTLPFETIYYGAQNPEVQVFGSASGASLEQIYFTVRELAGEEFCIHCGGLHNLQNALAAIAVGRRLGLNADELRRGLAVFENTGMRQKIIEIQGKTIINDSYNANPDSMLAALNVLNQAPGRRIAVLADMLELGEHAPCAHRTLGEQARERADLIFVTGDWRDAVAQGADGADVRTFDDVDALSAALAHEWRTGDTVLVKASRGMRLERVVDALCE